MAIDAKKIVATEILEGEFEGRNVKFIIGQGDNYTLFKREPGYDKWTPISNAHHHHLTEELNSTPIMGLSTHKANAMIQNENNSFIHYRNQLLEPVLKVEIPYSKFSPGSTERKASIERDVFFERIKSNVLDKAKTLNLPIDKIEKNLKTLPENIEYKIAGNNDAKGVYIFKLKENQSVTNFIDSTATFMRNGHLNQDTAVQKAEHKAWSSEKIKNMIETYVASKVEMNVTDNDWKLNISKKQITEKVEALMLPSYKNLSEVEQEKLSSARESLPRVLVYEYDKLRDDGTLTHFKLENLSEVSEYVHKMSDLNTDIQFNQNQILQTQKENVQPLNSETMSTTEKKPVEITGHLGFDPVERSLPGEGDRKATNLVVLVNVKNQKEPIAYSVSAFGDLGSKAGELKKGDKITVEGSLSVNEKDGKTYNNVAAKSFEKHELVKDKELTVGQVEFKPTKAGPEFAEVIAFDNNNKIDGVKGEAYKLAGFGAIADIVKSENLQPGDKIKISADGKLNHWQNAAGEKKSEMQYILLDVNDKFKEQKQNKVSEKTEDKGKETDKAEKKAPRASKAKGSSAGQEM